MLLLAACSQGAGRLPAATVSPASPGASVARSTIPGATSTGQKSSEPNVIHGRVTTEPGDPIAGARIRISGYIGGASLGQEIETVESGPDGEYRYDVPRGLYKVLGDATIAFDGQTYRFDLEPADGRCEEQMSDNGIVKDLVVRLTGLKPCRRAALPDNNRSYHGASIQLRDQLTGQHSLDGVVEFTLEPRGPLADGSTGRTLIIERTFAAFGTGFGPIDSTSVLYDIPLAHYGVTAQFVEPDGRRVPLFVSTATAPTPVAEVEVTFDASHLFGDPTVGYLIPLLSIHVDPAPG